MQVVSTNFVVSIEVRLVSAKHTEIVVDIVITGAIVVIQAASVGSVIGHDKVVVHLVVSGHRGYSFPITHSGQVGKPVPTVESAVIAGLPASVEEEVVQELVGAAEAVVEVYRSPGDVVHDVSGQSGLRCYGLEVKAALFLDQPNVVADVVSNYRFSRLIARSAVIVVCAAPGGDGGLAQAGKGAFGDGSTAVVPRQHDSF